MIINESIQDFSGYFVTFVYDGDALSPYVTTIIIKADSESDALAKAGRALKNSDKFQNARSFQIDRVQGKNGKLDSYTDYKNQYRNSNLEVITESIDLDQVKNKTDALTTLAKLYPGASNNLIQWEIFSDAQIELCHQFNISRQELKQILREMILMRGKRL